MIDIKTMLPDLRALVRDLAEDLHQQAVSQSAIEEKLRNEYKKSQESGRSSQGFEEYRDDYLEQVAVAWVLACVFVRFLEDNMLLDECWLAGEGDRKSLADGHYEIYFRSNPHATDREFLKFVFTEVGKIPAASELFAKTKTPLWAVDLSGDGARHLLNFFKEINPDVGGLKRSFTTQKANTGPIVEVYERLAPQAQFLGDLYQDLSEHARKKYALLQTPEFVEEFILDRTFTFALDEFGLKNLRIIDPACGSGHFLLGAFDRLFKEWMKPERGVNNKVVAAQNALDSIHGVDINPYAIAITRFRLLVAAIQACEINRLHQQTYAWKLNLATGDSLLWGSKPNFDGERIPISHQRQLFDPDPIFAVEDPAELRRILGQGYHVVVGNPPYITVKDKSQNEAYRELYSKTCYRQYSLAVPFTQKFWELAIRKGERITDNGEAVSPAAGYVGMITANSFMKREFGKKLIEEFFPKTDLTHVLDTSGAYIPGHGTPTVILFGRAQKPVGATVRAVLGIKGEPSTPEDPSQGMVWQFIVQQIDRADSQDDFTSTADIPRATFSSHPWSIGGGGAADLKELLEGVGSVLGGNTLSIGFYQDTHADEVFVRPSDFIKRLALHEGFRHQVRGDEVRDWDMSCNEMILFPYHDSLEQWSSFPWSCKWSWLWSQRIWLWERSTFGGGTYRSSGRPWYDYHQFPKDRARTPLSIAFAEVATHNHFVLDRGGKVFNRTAPIIKMPAEATEENHLALLGLLNSSTACFWFKQVCHNKGSSVDQHGARQRTAPFEDFYQFNGTRVGQFPLPESRPLVIAQKLDELGQRHSGRLPEMVVQVAMPTAEGLSEARDQAASIRGQMIAWQEELDWKCYQLYGLLNEDLCYSGDDLPELVLGQRAFEIVMARQMANGELETTWFERHGSTPITEIPADWPDEYRKVVGRRIHTIESNKEINLIERPEYKRRWNDESWSDRERRALKSWLLDWLETPTYRNGSQQHPELTTTAQMADVASGDAEFLQVAAIYRGREDFDVAALVAELVQSESVPFLPVLRYKSAGLRKREVWEKTWELQRKEDVGEDVGEIKVPPKYTSADFQSSDYWRLRGKLDVPKERWISFPHCETESDPSLVVGWAGWNHLQQATALIAYYDARKREGWDAKRLTPLLAGLDQLLPWIHQWHPEIDPEFGETAGQSFETMLKADAHELGLTLEDIRAWEPPAKKKGGRRKAKG